MSLRVLDLFSGIGGFSLGLERAGMRTVAFCEIDPFCRRVLAKHWPNVPCHDDVTTREFQEGEADVICGGFPCQDISAAGKRAGLAGERSGLWRELVRAIRLVRPRFAIVENVAALLNRGMGTVLGDLAEIGADAEWHCIPASAVGAPHRRDRVWIIAHPSGTEDHIEQECVPRGARAANAGQNGGARDVDHAKRTRLQAGRPDGNGNDGSVFGGREHSRHIQAAAVAGCRFTDPACADDGLPPAGALWRQKQEPRIGIVPRDVADSDKSRLEVIFDGNAGQLAPAFRSCGQWSAEPDVGRVAHGVPDRVDRLRSLGNAVVPQIPEIIGRAALRALSPDRSAA